ncbi:MAG: hypothetical protein U0842_15160 [Candidatus Binatia bacterium]
MRAEREGQRSGTASSGPERVRLVVHRRIAVRRGQEDQQRLEGADRDAADLERLERHACDEERRCLVAQELLDHGGGRPVAATSASAPGVRSSTDSPFANRSRVVRCPAE